MRRGGESGVEQKPKRDGSEPATLGQADPLGAGHDEVIQDPHIDQGQSVLEPGGDGAISLGGLTAPGGMVVGEDHGSGIAGQGLLYHHTGIYRRAINGAVEQGLEAEHLVLVVEEDGGEDLVLLLGQGHLQELGDIGGCSERVPAGQLIQQNGGRRTDNLLRLNAALYVVQALLVLYESGNIHKTPKWHKNARTRRVSRSRGKGGEGIARHQGGSYARSPGIPGCRDRYHQAWHLARHRLLRRPRLLLGRQVLLQRYRL